MTVAAAGPAPSGSVSPDDALNQLVAGNNRYRKGASHARDFAAGRAERVAVHRPLASILTCADARVGPEFVFDQGPGALFVVRVAGNILEEDGLASLEYAAKFLGSPAIFVLGHQNCGAVEAAIKVVKDNATLPGHLPGLIDKIKPAVLEAQKSNPPDLFKAAITANVRQSMAQVTSAGPILSDMIASGKVKVAGGVYDIGSGAIAMA
jgi:carbonic anhydrase